MSVKLGVITDVHADLGALQAAMARMHDLGVDLVVCAGDIVDGGTDPEGVIALLRERQIPAIKGNHDRWAVTRHDSGEPAHDGGYGGLWMRDSSIDWLRALPTRWDRTIEGVQVAVRHGTPLSDMDGIYPDAGGGQLESWLAVAEADVLVVGHTHIPLVKHVSGGKLVVNPGALWRGAEAFQAAMLVDPGGGPSRSAERAQGGCFGVLELPSTRWRQLRV